MHDEDERTSCAETVRSTTFETVSGVNAVGVADEGETAGEVVEEMIGIEIMVAEVLIAESIVTQDHHAAVIPEIEDHFVHLHQENRIHMFLAVVVDVDETNGADPPHRNQHLLHLPGQNPSHVHHLAEEIVQAQDLARQLLEDADLGRQIFVVAHTEDEKVVDEEGVQIVEPVEDHPLLHLPVLDHHDHLNADGPPHPNQSVPLLHPDLDDPDANLSQDLDHVHRPGRSAALPAEACLLERIKRELHQLQLQRTILLRTGPVLVGVNVTIVG
jgi:hypothetical protein